MFKWKEHEKNLCFAGRLLDPALTATLNLHQYILNAHTSAAMYAAGLSSMVRPTYDPFLHKSSILRV